MENSIKYKHKVQNPLATPQGFTSLENLCFESDTENWLQAFASPGEEPDLGGAGGEAPAIPMDVDFLIDDIPSLSEELESDFFEKDYDVIMSYFGEGFLNENNKRPRSAADAKENGGPNTPPSAKRHRASEALDIEMADMEGGVDTPDPYSVDFEAFADRYLQKQKTKHGIQDDLPRASTPTDLLELQDLWTQLDSAVERSGNIQNKKSSEKVVPATFAAPSSQPVSSASAPAAVAAPGVAVSSGVAATSSAIGNIGMYNDYPRRQRNAVERWVDRVPTPPKRRPSRQKKAKAAGTAMPSASSDVLVEGHISAPTWVNEDNRRSKDIESILSAVQRTRKQRSARNVVANANPTASEGGPFLVEEGLSDDNTAVYVDVGINREENINFVLSAALETRRYRKGAPRRPRQFSVAPALAAIETAVVDVCISEQIDSDSNKLSEKQPAIFAVVVEKPVALEASQPLAGKPKPKTISAWHTELASAFPAAVVDLEEKVLDFSKAFPASGPGYFTAEIMRMKKKKERHTARLLAIQERLKWVEGELIRDGNSYGWKGGIEPAAGSNELYRAIALKFLRDRLNYMRSQEFRNGADKSKKTVKSASAKSAKITKRKSKK
ncbi:hypothetical protein NADE_003339 [Nannochloris sp. 'desiccata']|nr:hypothetical protein NADE_003339 [Chlorella desiccata (nom. nud.)]